MTVVKWQRSLLPQQYVLCTKEAGKVLRMKSHDLCEMIQAAVLEEGLSEQHPCLHKSKK